MGQENVDTETEEIKKRLRCTVRPGQWGVAYGIAWQVITWGKISEVSPAQKVVWIEAQVNQDLSSGFVRRFVEVFDDQDEARKRFESLFVKRSEGG